VHRLHIAEALSHRRARKGLNQITSRSRYSSGLKPDKPIRRNSNRGIYGE
jgi:sRNA-binding protein